MTVHPMAYNMNTRVRWAIVERFLDSFDIAGCRVLDVGCGLGFFSARFQERGALVDGIDVDAAAVDYVVQHIGARAEVVDVESTPLPSGYDLVFVGEVLEHLKHPLAFYQKVYEALRPGGFLVLTTPALEGWLTHSRGKQLGHDHGGQKHEREGFWKSDLENFARSAGLETMRHEFCLFTAAELFMQVTKIGYLMSRKDYDGQSDVLALIKKPSFKLLRFIFPIAWGIVSAEDRIARAIGMRGHCHLHVARRRMQAEPGRRPYLREGAAAPV